MKKSCKPKVVGSKKKITRSMRGKITKALMLGLIFNPDHSGGEFVRRLSRLAKTLGYSPEDFDAWHEAMKESRRKQLQVASRKSEDD